MSEEITIMNRSYICINTDIKFLKLFLNKKEDVEELVSSIKTGCRLVEFSDQSSIRYTNTAYGSQQNIRDILFTPCKTRARIYLDENTLYHINIPYLEVFIGDVICNSIKGGL